MLKLTLTAIAVAAIVALPAAYGSSSTPAQKSVASTLLRQMNSSPAGRITRRVTCTPTARHGSFDCDLQSTISTHLTAHVDRVGGELVTTWHPLAG